MTNKKELELYIHIPFCVRKCAYCDFLSGPADSETIDRYVGALMKEIRACRRLGEAYRVVTVFLGGGTPSVLSGRQMEALFRTLREVFEIDEQAEITVEANPGTVTREKLDAYRRAGINRLSFGLQSVNNEELKLLGRIHTFEEFLDSYRMAKECGFDNINVDLISAIPKQTLASWERTLKTVIALKPEHISAYSLIVEDGTPFAALYGEGAPGKHDLPDEEEERLIYKMTKRWLGEAGYHRYEISNYAREGRECKHNLGYWERKNYLGIGLGASSLMENVRFCNTGSLETYIACSGNPEQIRTETEQLDAQEQREEFIFLGLRKMEGISERVFYECFGRTLNDCYGDNMDRLMREGLLERYMRGSTAYVRLTERGIDISNYVFAELLSV